MKISASSSNAYRSCKKRFYYYKTQEFKTNLNFIYGIAFETGFEESLKLGLDIGIEKGLKKFWEQEPEKAHKENLLEKDEYTPEKLKEDIDTSVDLLPNMVTRLYEKVNEMKIEFISNQFKIVSKLENGNLDEGKFDGIVEYNGKNYIWELKGCAPQSIKSPEQIKLDNQVLNYLYIANDKGMDVDGIIYCQVVKKIPKEPKINNNGELSTNKKQGCDKEEYLEFAKNMYDEIPEKVMSCYEELKPFIFIDIIPTDKELLENYKYELLAISEEMDIFNKEIKSNPTEAFKKCYTNRGLHCSYCSYKYKCEKGEL